VRRVPFGSSHYFKFTTRNFSTGAPYTLAGTPVISVYEENNLTQITAGVTLTADYDSVTGLNSVAVVASGANGYEVGKTYAAVITTGTVNSVSVVGEVVDQFEVVPAENTAGYPLMDVYSVGGTTQTANDNGADINAILVDTNSLNDTKIPQTLNLTASGNIGIDWANVENPTTAVDLSATDIQLCDTVTTNTDMRGTDSALLAASAPTNFGDLSITATTGRVDVASVAGTAQTANDNGADINAILTDTGTSIPATLSTIAGYIDTEVVSIKSVTDNLPDSGALTTLITHLTDIKGATFSGATDSLEAIRNRGDAAWTTGAGGTPPQLLQSTTIATLASQTNFTLTAGSADDGAYPAGSIVVVTDQTTSTQKAVGSVSSYTGGTKTVVLSADPGVFTMAVGDTVEIIAALGSAGSGPTAVQIRQEIDTNSTQLAAIKAVTDNMPDSGAFTTIISNITDIQSRIPAALVGGRIDANASAINNNNTAILNLEKSAGTIIRGAAQTGTLSTTEMTTDITISVADQLKGRVIIFDSDTSTAALRNQATDITACVVSGGKLTFTALTTAPSNGDTFVVV